MIKISVSFLEALSSFDALKEQKTEADESSIPSFSGLLTLPSIFLYLSESSKYFIKADDRIGGIYKKALYVEYTDETFSSQKNRNEDELHLGSLGPVIRGEVGDTIEVVFKNKVSFFIFLVTCLRNQSRVVTRK